MVGLPEAIFTFTLEALTVPARVARFPPDSRARSEVLRLVPALAVTDPDTVIELSEATATL